MDHSQLAKNRGGIVQLKCYEEMLVKSKQGTSRHNEPLQAVVENQLHESALNEPNNSVLERNRALLQYIATLANSNSNTDEFNYEFVDSLIDGGADINTADQYEQTIFHEVARSWNVDVAKFLIKHGCNINKKDCFGRTPLHVAAAVDYVEMTEFLLQNNADIDARTSGEEQAPIHYAAKNGAVGSLKMLLGFQATIDSTDAKQRTPLQVAAEWTRGETAKVLIEEGAASCILDTCGNSALTLLIERLPHLAVDALNQLHTTNIITMKDYYYLQYLDGTRQKIENSSTRTALETAVALKKYEVVTHPVMQRLIHNKWLQFGRLSTVVDLVFHFIFGIAWTALSMGTPTKGKELYGTFEARAWRIFLGVVVILMTIYDIASHVRSTIKARRSQKKWIDWKTSELEYDLSYCHPRWPQERKYIKHEIKRVNSLPLFDAYDAWFYMEWIILLLIVATIASHIVYFDIDTQASRDVYTRTISIVNLLVWLRLLKYVRPIPGIGTLVIILGETSGDFINWAFLFFLLFVPFTAAFWINFGELSLHPIHGYHNTRETLYSVFRMSIGDEFNLEEMVGADAVMARILVFFYVTAMSIVTLNLLIALLTDTFSRVYNNAVANTIMQRAIKVIQAERVLTKNFRRKYEDHIKTNCSPEVIPMSVGENNPETRPAKAEYELMENIRVTKRVLDDRFSTVYGRNKMSDLDSILCSVKKLKENQTEFSDDLRKISEMVKSLGENGKRGGQKHSAIVKKTATKTSSGGSISNFFGLFTQSDKGSGSTTKKKRSRNKNAAHGKRVRRTSDRSRTRQGSDPEVSNYRGSETSIVPYQSPHVRSGRVSDQNDQKTYAEIQDDISL